MNLIVNVAEDWAIGKGNSLLFHLSRDMKYFKANTIEKTVVMGRKTLESLPGGKPLPNRRNIVLTRNREYAPQGVEVYNSIEELLEAIKDTADDDIMVMGGASVYEALLPYCAKAYVTKVSATVDGADAYMVNLDDDENWQISEQSPLYEEKGYSFKFVTYTRK